MMGAMATSEETTPRRYSTFEGVFTPTVLTILGVILYLRTGWVVGNAGLLGAIVIILLGYTITGSTGLSISSVATNTRLAGGGAYAIISRSLGLEAGGAIGIPLYLAQTLVIALYVFGFRGGWSFVFPNHPALAVDLLTFGAIVAIASVSARFAFRVQYLILALIGASVVSVGITVFTDGPTVSPTLWGSYPGAPEDGFTGTDFWSVFAVFFPATTGIMAGVNLSGELADSRRSIPRGTLTAIGVSLLVYLGAAIWLARVATMDELASDYLIMIERSAWGPAVVGGLLGATFSSALASIVGAPRILQALGQERLLPRSAWFARRTAGGEPRNAFILTAVIALAAIALRDLNVLAPIITLFFLITYGTINVVVVVEQTLDLPTFRPTLRVPRIVPAIGALGCIFAMVIVNALFTIIAVTVILGIMVALLRRRLDTPFSDVRSDMFAALSQWAGRQAKSSRQSAERGWRPRVLAPVVDSGDLDPALTFLRDLTYPKGTVKLVGVKGGPRVKADELAGASEQLSRQQVATTWSVLDDPGGGTGMAAAVRAPGSGLSRSNIVFVRFPLDQPDLGHVGRVIEEAHERDLGVVMLATGPGGRLGGRGVVNLWIREQSPDWEVSTNLQHSHLAILLSYKLVRNWGGNLNLVTAVSDPAQAEAADAYLHGLVELARLPGPPGVHVLGAGFLDALSIAPRADLNVFALPPDVDFDLVRRVIGGADSPCAFVRDSGLESAFL